MYQSPQKKRNRGCLQIMRDQAWGFIFGFLSLIVALAGLLFAIPQAAPIRNGFAQTFSNSSKPSEPSMPQVSVTKQLSSGTITFNRELSCGICTNPLIATVNQAIINPTEQNMVWNVNVLNRSVEELSFYFTQFSIQGPTGNSYPGTGNLLNISFIDAGEHMSKNVIFPLIPNKGEIYVLTASFSTGEDFPDVNFNPSSFTF